MRVNIDDTDFDDGLRYFYKGEPLTGEAVETDPDGNMNEITTFRNGVEEGPQLAWYSDGSRKYESMLSNGNPIGVVRKWYRNGQLQEEREFDQNGRMSKVRQWNEDGSLTVEQQVGA